MTGEELYREWLGDPEGVTGAPRYFPAMNPADQERWNKLAAKFTVYRETIEGVRTGLGRWGHGTEAMASLLGTLNRVLNL